MPQYKVTINLDNETSVATYPTVDGHPSADDKTKGGVNPFEWTDMHHPPTDTDYAWALARGNMRWNAIFRELCKAGTYQFYDEFAEGMEIADHQPTVVSFEVKWKINPLPVYQYYLENDQGNLTGHDGATIDTAEKAIKQMVTDGICAGGTTGFSFFQRVHNHQRWNDTNETVTIYQPDVPSKVIQDITVEEVPETYQGS
jgi:hypothetical protein